MIQSSRGVFLSYASEDAGVAKRICDALRTAGIEVWFDQSELRGGDAWDQKIRQQIRDCALFVPIISANTQVRSEGYFRLEWKLAVDRSHLMVAERAFLVPVVADATTEPEALVPVQFREVQWTRIQAGEVLAAFAERIVALLNQPVAHHVDSPARGVNRVPTRRLPVVLIALAVAAAVGLAIATAMHGGWLGHKPVPKGESGTASTSVATMPAAIPEKSIAVLPFVDMSEKHDQEYFSDGLSEELIDMLTKVPDLRVPARTSSFYFKGKQTTIKDIAAALGVSHILEGSVRRSGTTLRITVQLIRVDNGYHLWSETYDRKLDDIFRIQDEIARAVVTSLQSSLRPNALPQGAGTADSAAYTLYLQARKINQLATTRAEWDGALQLLREAVARDPKFADGWAWIAFVHSNKVVSNLEDDQGIAEMRQASARAVLLRTKSANAHTIAADILWDVDWNWVGAEAEFRRAYELEPSAADNAIELASTMLTLGRDPETFRELYDKAIAGDPANWFCYYARSIFHSALGELADAENDARKALELNASGAGLNGWLSYVLLLQHKYEDALVEVRKEKDDTARRQGMAETYYALGKKADADAALRESEKLDAANGAVGIAENYAYRGEMNQAFSWLERAYRHRDQSLPGINHDPLMKNLYGDPRWKAFLGKVKLPELSRNAYPGVY